MSPSTKSSFCLSSHVQAHAGKHGPWWDARVLPLICLAAVLCGCGGRATDSQNTEAIYDFEKLELGALSGQDGWTAPEGALIEAGDGINRSKVLTFGAQDGDLENPVIAKRDNDMAFAFPSLTGDKATLRLDFRVVDPASTNNNAYALLSVAPLEGPSDLFEGRIGLGYDGVDPADRVYIQLPGMHQAGSWENFSHQHGNWYRLILRIDFAGDGGQGMASATVSDLTTGSSAKPIEFLTETQLGIKSLDRSAWQRMEVSAVNVQLDNLCIDAK
jgi:hypothetical protein